MAARYLYRRLTSNGLRRVFFDKEEMQKAQKISRQIIEAIGGASVHIAIFSPRYAESLWCLDELVLMAESGKAILPVFYKVNPLWSVIMSELERTLMPCETLQRKLHRRMILNVTATVSFQLTKPHTCMPLES